MSLFRKPKKNVRNRGPVGQESDDDQDNSVEEIQASISKLKEKKKDKKKNKDKASVEKKSSLLSFDDVEEEDDLTGFKVKKSSASRRLIKEKEKGKKDDFQSYPKTLTTHSTEPERIHSKNGNTENKNNYDNTTIIDNDIEIVLKDNVPKKSIDTWTLSGVEAEALHMEEEEDADNESEKEEESDEEEDPIQKIIQSGGIPDAAAIHAARKKREAARAKGGRDDFIPIKKKDKDKAGGPRLVREEDEELDDEERVNFTKSELSKVDEYHTKVSRREVDSDSDPEWEKMQISKAISGQQIVAASLDAQMNYELGMPQAPLPPSISGDQSRKEKQEMTRPVKYDLPGIRERMKKRLVEMREVSKRRQTDGDKVVDDLVESQMEVDRIETRIPQLSEKHKFFQELRGYVTDLTDCYDEKVGVISYLEGRLLKLYSETRGKLRERRRQDVKDAVDTLTNMTASYMALGLDPVQDAVKDFRVAEREGRRIRRRKYRQEKGDIHHKEGLSSDDEITGADTSTLAKVRQDIQNQTRGVLEDVVEEFSVISKVAGRLSDWREKDPDSYQSAYVSLCLPRIFGPLIRLQQLFWSPLTKDTNISDQDWYTSLAKYSCNQDENFAKFETDPDRNLVSLSCEKILLPKLVHLTRSVYDPMSTSQTNRLVSCINKLVANFPTITSKSKHLRELVDVVVENIKECLDNDIYIPMYNKSQLVSPNSPHSLFYQRQFWTTFKLFRNILAWQGIISDPVLSSLVLDRILNRYILLSLRSNVDILDSVDKSKQIVACLPSWWTVAGTQESAKLIMLNKFVLGLGSNKSMARDGVLECARILAKLGDHDTSEKLRELLVS